MSAPPSSSAAAVSLALLHHDGRVPLVLVATFDALVEAELARGRLDVENIPCRIVDETLVGMSTPLAQAMGGVKLWVPVECAEQARAVLYAPGVEAPAEPETALDVPVAASPRPVTDEERAMTALLHALYGAIALPVVFNVTSILTAVRLIRTRGWQGLSDDAKAHLRAAVCVDAVVFALVSTLLFAL